LQIVWVTLNKILLHENASRYGILKNRNVTTITIRDNYCHRCGSAFQWTLSSEIPWSKIKHISSVLGYKHESASVLELWFWLQLQEHLYKF